MEDVQCLVCGRTREWSGRGVRPKTCGQRCRQRMHRMPQSVPEALTQLPRWTTRDGKRPTQPNGSAASSTDPSTWTTFDRVSDQPHGVMLGDGLACWDLDNVIDDDGVIHPEACEVLQRVGSKALWVELSLSGKGVHVFVHSDERTAVVTPKVSYYAWGRFISVTGVPLTR